MEREVKILYIYVHPDHRGKKYGQNLIQEMTKDVIDKMKNNHIDHFEIHLDDMTDNFSKSNNIYLKMGFEYCEIDQDGPCGPEMYKKISLSQS
jgi:ribosomal protein S18 acetylase RimI-like enzyme